MFDFLKQKDRTPPVLPEGTVRRHFSISGQVQGVGFRYRARYAAQALELTGWVENEDDGSVTLEVQGDPDKFPELFAMIQRSDYVHRHPAEGPAARPLGAGLLGARLLNHRCMQKRRTQVRPPFCSFYLQPAILRGELAVQMVPSSSRVSASVPLAETRAGSSA